jgi:hypothetical protein
VETFVAPGAGEPARRDAAAWQGRIMAWLRSEIVAVGG